MEAQGLLELVKREGPEAKYLGMSPVYIALFVEKDLALAGELLKAGASFSFEWLALVERPLMQNEKTRKFLEALAERFLERTRGEGLDKKEKELLRVLVEWGARAGDGFLRPLGAVVLEAVRDQGEKKEYRKTLVKLGIDFLNLEAFQLAKELGELFGRKSRIVRELFRSDRLGGPGIDERRLRILQFLVGEGVKFDARAYGEPPLLYEAINGFRNGEACRKALRILVDRGLDPFEKVEGKYLTAYCQSAKPLRFLLDLGVPIELELQQGGFRELCRLDAPRVVEAVRQRQENGSYGKYEDL